MRHSGNFRFQINGLIENSSRGVWAIVPDKRHIETIDAQEIVRVVRELSRVSREARKRELAERIAAEQKRAEESATKSELFEDFSSAKFVDLQHPADRRQSLAIGHRPEQRWFATGWSFGDGPNVGGIAHSGELSTKLRGVLRSPTFTITQPQILYRVSGKNARIRLIIDGYQMMDFSGLLFGGTTFEVNTDGKWIWHRQAGDLQNYIGRRAYIELIDDGDGWIACDEIRFTNGGPEPATPPHPNHAQVIANASIRSVPELAKAVNHPGERPTRSFR